MSGNSKALKRLIGCALVAFTMLLAASGVYRNWWPMLLCFLWFFLPMPMVLSSAFMSSEDKYAETLGVWEAFGLCLTSVVIVTLFGVPTVMLTTEAMGAPETWIVFASNVVLLGGFGWYSVVKAREDDDDYLLG
mmetsp:Transcript_136848/g.193544  ORF Transcript_136848/g.193544 Transcript_136848/m.193544 type:complete len:134 (-) Transcript_136848:235-636(-)